MRKVRAVARRSDTLAVETNRGRDTTGISLRHTNVMRTQLVH